MGTPVASVFCAPQKTIVTSSCLLKPSIRAAAAVMTRTRASSMASMTNNMMRSSVETRCQTPFTTAALNAE